MNNQETVSSDLTTQKMRRLKSSLAPPLISLVRHVFSETLTNFMFTISIQRDLNWMRFVVRTSRTTIQLRQYVGNQMGQKSHLEVFAGLLTFLMYA